MRDPIDLLILGSGPTGLEAALAAHQAGIPFRLLEGASEVAGGVRSWGHVRLFSPWSVNVSPRMRHALEAAGRPCPEGEACPTGAELVEELLEPIARLPSLAPHLETNRTAVAIGRERGLKHEQIGAPDRGHRPFRVLVRTGRSDETIVRAWQVLDCTGSLARPNQLGDGGIPAPGELALEDRICRRIPDVGRHPHPWRGKSILLVGGGHSAQTAVRDLARLAVTAPATKVIWALRQPEPSFRVIADDPLPERARLVQGALELVRGASPNVEPRLDRVVEGLRLRNGRAKVRLRSSSGDEELIEVDRILSLTGSVGDHLLYRELQVQECYATAGPMALAAALLGETGGDCLTQQAHGAETLSHPEPGFFILGAKSYGRNTTFLMRVGYEQVNEVLPLLQRRSQLSARVG